MQINDSSQEAFANSLNDSELFKYLNLKLQFIDNRVLLRLDPIQQRHRGGSTGDSVNGAIIAAISDIAVGATIGLSPHFINKGSGVGRLEIKMQKPIQGSFFSIEANIINQPKNLIYVKVDFFDENNQLCVQATGTVFIKKS